MDTNQETWLRRNPNAGLILYSTVGAAIVAFALLTNWPTYHYSIRGGPPPTLYYVLPVVFVIPILFAHPAFLFRYLREPLTWWFLAFVLTGLASLLLAQDFIEEASHQWRLRLLAFGLFYSIAILATNVHRSTIAVVVVMCILLATAANWFDILRPFRFVPQGVEGAHSGRGAGFFINPNVAASFIAMAAIAALPFLRMRFRTVVLLVAAIGITPTFSKSGFLYVALLLMGPIVLGLLDRVQKTFLLVAVPVLIAITFFSFDFLMSSSDDANLHNVVRRLEWFQGLGNEGEDQAVALRALGAQQAWHLFLDQPITGHGLGATSLESAGMEGPHNMYLTLMGEQGFVGFFLYASLIAIFFWQGRRVVSMAADKNERDVGQALMLYAAFLFAYGFFSHNVLEEAQSIFIMSFMAAAAATVPRGAFRADVAVGGRRLIQPRSRAQPGMDHS